MRRIWRSIGKLLRGLAGLCFCQHPAIGQRRNPDDGGRLWLLCFCCLNWIAPAGFEASELGRRLDRQQKAAQKAAVRRARHEALRRQQEIPKVRRIA